MVFINTNHFQNGSAFQPHGSGSDVYPQAGVTAHSPIFIAGLSMGGFGALRLASKFPDRFAGASAHSAITEFAQMRNFVEEPLDAYAAPADDRSVLATLLRNQSRLLPLRFACGTEDPLLAANRTFHSALAAAAVPHQYQKFPGVHAWDYWQTHVADTLKFFAAALARTTRLPLPDTSG